MTEQSDTPAFDALIRSLSIEEAAVVVGARNLVAELETFLAEPGDA